MAERKYDKLFRIKTVGIRERWDGTNNYNRYEATPYAALDKLFKRWKFGNIKGL